MYFITKRLKTLPMAHRLPGHKGDCSALHGHNYLVEITVKARDLNKMGFVIDFADLKGFEQLLRDRYDHCTLLWQEDPLFKFLSSLPTQSSSEATGKLVGVPFIPTVENISQHWLAAAQEWLIVEDRSGRNMGVYRGVVIHSLTAWETPTSKATAYANEKE